MTGTITKKFRLLLADQFINLFEDTTDVDNLYVFIGKPTPWVDDNNPPVPVDVSSLTDYNIWTNIDSVKKISPSDVTYAVPRYDWTYGTVYNQYTADTTYYNGQFYVMTTEYNIYKCLWNNHGAESVVQPTGRLTTSFGTDDGYIWKFMGEVLAANAVKYLTSSYIPVRRLITEDTSFQWDVQQAAVNGSIETIGVSSGGQSYPGARGFVRSATTTTITFDVSAAPTAGVYVNSSVYINAGTGVGQIREIISYNGGTRTATINGSFDVVPDGTSQYTLGPTLSPTGDGSGLVAYSVVANGVVTAANVINIGKDYGYCDLAAVSNTYAGGTGASFVPEIAPPGGHGYSIVDELYGHNIIMAVDLQGSESGTVYANNDFRIVGILRNPLLESTKAIANNVSYMVTPQLTISSPSGYFSTDEIINGATSGAQANIVEYANTNTLTIYNMLGEFQSGETITGNTSTTHATVVSVENSPFVKYSGEVLYIEYRTPVVRSPLQEESFLVTINF